MAATMAGFCLAMVNCASAQTKCENLLVTSSAYVGVGEVLLLNGVELRFDSADFKDKDPDVYTVTASMDKAILADQVNLKQWTSIRFPARCGTVGTVVIAGGHELTIAFCSRSAISNRHPPERRFQFM